MTRRVLIVDDDKMLLSGLKRALHDEPFRVETENSPEQALKRVALGDIDVVISDHDMPGMTGAALLAEVCKQDPTIVRFMLTGKATLDMAIAAINDGSVDRFFTKPCNHFDLATTVRTALDQRDLLAESRQLLWLYRKKEAQLEMLERDHPNLTKVEYDETGAILLEDLPTDIDGLRSLMADLFGGDPALDRA